MEDWQRYADIIDLEHPEPKTHPRMASADRAAQFSSFAALTGYEAMVAETSRLTGSRVELDEEQRRALNESISDIVGRTAVHPKVRIVHFVPDKRKNGGEYVTIEGFVQNVELPNRKLVLKDGTTVTFDDILFVTVLDD